MLSYRKAYAKKQVNATKVYADCKKWLTPQIFFIYLNCFIYYLCKKQVEGRW